MPRRTRTRTPVALLLTLFLPLSAAAALLACGSTGDAPSTTVDARPSPPTPDAHPGGCVPTIPPTEVCDGVDNDCNGKIDDVDVGGDGIYDCQHIAILGNPGANGSSNFTAWLTGNGSQVDRLLTNSTAVLTADLIAGYKVIIVDRITRSYTTDEAAALESWVEAGGGLMTMSGYSGGQSDLDFPNSLLAPLGLAYVSGLLSGPVTMFSVHPITQGLSSVTFSGGFPVSPSDAGVTGGTNITVATITGKPVGIVQTRGAGRVFVWGDEWITFDSEWSSMPMIKAFWVDILSWLEGLR